MFQPVTKGLLMQDFIMIKVIENLRQWNYKGKLMNDVVVVEMDVNYCVFFISLAASMHEVRPN